MNKRVSLWNKIVNWINNGSYTVFEEDEKEIINETANKSQTINKRFKKCLINTEINVLKKYYNVIASILSIIIILCLLYSVSFLPSFANTANPANNEVAQKYVEDSIKDTGAVNAVAGMILDYRAFDTFGESVVLFTAACSVITLLKKTKNNEHKEKKEDSIQRIKDFPEDSILKYVTTVLVPLILMYGIYVVLNGHLSPGGGFSGGTIIGAGFILYYSSYGYKRVSTFFNYQVLKKVMVIALGFYAIAKSYSFYTGANHIESIIPKGIIGNLLSSGLILPLNIAVGIVVACTVFSFFILFTKEDI